MEVINNIGNDLRRQTNWYVITGGPASGKTTAINLLKARGHNTTIENARHYLETQRSNGKSVEEIREHQAVFQSGILDMQIEQEKAISPDDIVFLDRAIPDSVAYYRLLNLYEGEKLLTALRTVSYKKIFILDCLPIVKDYARTEDAEAQRKIHALLVEVYTFLGFPIIKVPVLPPEERVDFILKNL